jgi:glycosyltransferase involved in cell wall biosynthesis
VFSGTNPAVALLFVATLKRIIGFKWLLLVHDVFPENLVPAGILRNDSSLYWVVRRIFDIVYSLADILVAIGRDMREALIKKTKNDSRVIYIPNWVDADDVMPILRESNELLPEDGWKNKTVFQFFGNLGRVQGLDNLLLALPHVKNTNAAFVFIGSGAQEELITAFIDRYPRLSIIRVPRLSFADNAKGLSACDVAIVSLAKGMEGLAVPSKAYFSLAADKPLLVVSDENSELHMLVRESKGLGWFCRSGDPIALAETIDAICNFNLAELRGSPRLAVIQSFSYNNAIKLYAECIRELGAKTAEGCA